jgi:hypothetical protein
LLFAENIEEIVVLGSLGLSKTLESLFVFFASEETRIHDVHELLSKLTVSLFYDTGKHFVVLGGVFLYQLHLVVSLEEPLHLGSKLQKRVLIVFFNNFIPKFVFESGVGQVAFNHRLDLLSCISLILFEGLCYKFFLLVNTEVRTGIVVLDNSVSVLISQGAS